METRAFAESYITARAWAIGTRLPMVTSTKHSLARLSLAIANALLYDLAWVTNWYFPSSPDERISVFSDTFRSLERLVLPRTLVENDRGVSTFRKWFDKPNLEIVSDEGEPQSGTEGTNTCRNE